MVEVFKNVAIENKWHFDYGRSDFHNLNKISAVAEYFLFLDPIEENVVFSEYTAPVMRVFSGRFMLLMQSDFDRLYHSQQATDEAEGKYHLYIKKCKENAMLIAEALCGKYQIKQWKMLEVINLFDENFDGVLVNFQFETI